MPRKTLVPLNIRISESLMTSLRERADHEGADISKVVRDALSNYLENPSLSVVQRLATLERRVSSLENSRSNSDD